ncbi:MAG: hypothetical protein DRI61_06325, partial [Chloroflexi bacterium]
SGTCINITSSDVIFDGNGHSITGTDLDDTYGIYVYNSTQTLTNITLKNVVLSHWNRGIYIRNSGDVAIQNITSFLNTVGTSTYYSSGIYSTSSYNLSIKDANGSYNDYGILFWNVENSSIKNSIFNDNTYYGIWLRSNSDNNIIENTSTLNNRDGMRVTSSENITISNSNASYNSRYGVVVGSSNNNILENVTVLGNTNYGVYIYDDSENITISNSNINNNYHGIYIYESNNTAIKNNSINKNEDYGVWVYGSSNVTILENKINGNNQHGIYLLNTTTSVISENKVKNNIYYGIWLYNSNLTNITSNYIINNSYGIYFTTPTTDNLVYNNLLNNTNNFLYSGSSYPNNWNTTKQAKTNIVGGSHIGGNAWLKPDGTGFSQTCSDSDGDDICDSAYTLTTGNIDYLPLKYTPRIKVSVSTDDDKYEVGETVKITTNTTEYIDDNPTISNVTTDIIKGNATIPWWNTSFKYRIPITISEQSGNDLSDYQIKITIDTQSLINQGKMQSDCDDIRFAWFNSSNQSEEISYWLESGCNTNSTKIWIKVPYIPANSNVTIYMYYGNSSVSSHSNKNKTFTGEFYVVSDALATSNLNVVSYVDGNAISDGTTTLYLNRGETGTFSSSDLSATTKVYANGSFSSGFAYSGAGDPLTPVAFAGKNFTFVAVRGTQSLDFLSPWGDANVTVYEGTTFRTSFVIPKGGHHEYNYNFGDENTVIIRSNISILIHHEDESSNYDFFPLYPATDDLWGVPSCGGSGDRWHIACAEDGTQITIYYSNGDAVTRSCNAGETITLTTPEPVDEGCCLSAHVVANKKAIGSAQIADTDGTEGTIFLPEDELDYEYYLPQDAQYITVATTQPYTNCTLYFSNSSGTFTETKTSGGLSRPYPNHIYFGSTADGTHIYAGAHLICDAPVYVYYEYSATNGETNWFGFKQNRKYVYPEPTVSIGDEQELIATNSSITGSTGIWTWHWDSSGQSIGNYSAVSLASKTGYVNGYGYAWFELTPPVPPEVYIITPANGAILGGVVNINATVTDGTGVSQVYAIVSNSTFSAIYNMSLYEGDNKIGNWSNSSFDTTKLMDGYYNITINATDIVGLSNTTQYVTVLIDNYVPDVMFVNPTPENNSAVDTSYVYINVTINDAGDIGILEWNGTNYTMNKAGYTNFWYNVSFSGYYVGNYTFRVYINDSAGNSNVSEVRTITVKGRIEVNAVADLAPDNITAPCYNVTMLKFNLTAKGENISISSLRVKKTGNYPYSFVNVSVYLDVLGNTISSSNTSLQADDVLLSGPKTFSSSRYATMPLSLVVNVSKPVTLVIVYDVGKIE